MTRRLISGKSFFTAQREAIARLKQRLPNVEIDFKNDLTRFLTDLAAYAVETLSFHLDVQANEGFLSTAQFESSVDQLSAIHDYNPSGAVSASGELTVRPKPPPPGTLVIPKGFRFRAASGLVYETTQSYQWQSGEQDYKAITLSQGQSREAVFASSGSRWQRFDLAQVQDGEFLSYQELTVMVDGVEWSEVDRFSDTSDEHYRVAYIATPPYIEFGDGAAGTVPPPGAEVRVSFRTTSGRIGNIDPGKITAALDSLLVAGESQSLEIDITTGKMTGGGDPESLLSIKTLLPLVHHSDGAVVTKGDFDGVLNTYSHPLFGSVARATAVVARSIENDVTSLTLIDSLLGMFMDADAAVQARIALLNDADTEVTGVADELTTIMDAILVKAQAGGAIATSLASALNQKATILSEKGKASNIATAIQSVSGEARASIEVAQTLSTDIRSEVNASVIDPTKTSLLAKLDDLDEWLSEAHAKAQGGQVIFDKAQAIITAMAAVDASLTTLDTDLASLETSRSDVETQASLLTTESSILTNEVANIAFVSAALTTDLQDPWATAVAKIGDLRSHLDGVFAGCGGPNLITVLALTYDADGFYASPSIGFLRAFEAELDSRAEPSVVIRVVDGSAHFVHPRLEVTLKESHGQSVHRVKALAEAQIFKVLKGRKHGSILTVDSLYEELEQVEGLDFFNVKITGFIANPSSSAFIDSDGNLIISRQEVVSRPHDPDTLASTVTYYRRVSDTQKELI